MANVSKTIKAMLAHNASDINVLIVDDDEKSLNIYKVDFKKLFLTKFKYVKFVKNSTEAYKLLNDKPGFYHLVVIDITTPSVDGINLIKDIRRVSFDRKIIAITSEKNMSDLQECITYGVDGIILKPYDEEAIYKVLLRILQSISMKQDILIYKSQLQELSQANANLSWELQQLKKVNSSLVQNPIKTVNEDDMLLIETTKTHAKDFVSTLGYDEVTRIEDFQDTIDNLNTLLCSLEEDNSKTSKHKLNEIAEYFYEFKNILDSFIVFYTISCGFSALVEFLQNIKQEDLEDIKRKQLLVNMLLGLIDDLDNWINVIFNTKETDNINYLDASFLDICKEIETIFDNTSPDDLIDDLEFF